LIFNFAVRYAILRVQINQNGFKLNGRHHLSIFADDINPLKADLNPICHLLALLGAHPILHISRIRVNILVSRVYSTNNSMESLIIANEESFLEVNAGNTKYMVLLRDQNARRYRSIKTDNNSFEKLVVF
jgi:hypothetical protein